MMLEEDMVSCVAGGEANSFFMGGRECEDGKGKRGGGVKLVLEMVTVFEGDIEWTSFLFNLWSFFSLVSLFLTCRIIGGHSILFVVG
jgi:hypothetical protein